MGSRGRALALLLLGVALVAGGCGSSNSFKDKYNEKAKQFNKIGPDVQSAVRSVGTKSGKDVKKQFDSLASRTSNAVDDLATLKPPSDAKAEFDKLISTFRTSVQGLRDVGTAAASGSQAKLKRASQQLVKQSNDVIAAEVALRKKVDK